MESGRSSVKFVVRLIFIVIDVSVLCGIYVCVFVCDVCVCVCDDGRRETLVWIFYRSSIS